jgi:hypothetical protein
LSAVANPRELSAPLLSRGRWKLFHAAFDAQSVFHCAGPIKSLALLKSTHTDLMLQC